jgi:hypothetical protein
MLFAALQGVSRFLSDVLEEVNPSLHSSVRNKIKEIGDDYNNKLSNSAQRRLSEKRLQQEAQQKIIEAVMEEVTDKHRHLLIVELTKTQAKVSEIQEKDQREFIASVMHALLQRSNQQLLQWLQQQQETNKYRPSADYIKRAEQTCVYTNSTQFEAWLYGLSLDQLKAAGEVYAWILASNHPIEVPDFRKRNEFKATLHLRYAMMRKRYSELSRPTFEAGSHPIASLPPGPIAIAPPVTVESMHKVEYDGESWRQ